MVSIADEAQPGPRDILEDSLQLTVGSTPKPGAGLSYAWIGQAWVPLEAEMHNLGSGQGQSSAGGKIYKLVAQHSRQLRAGGASR